MGKLFSPKVPKPPKPPPVPDEGDADAAADRLREKLGKRAGRRGTVLTKTTDSQSGRPRPRATALGGPAE